MKKGVLVSIILLIFACSLVSAENTEFAYNNLNLPTLSRTVINFTQQNTNNSICWDGDCNRAVTLAFHPHQDVRTTASPDWVVPSADGWTIANAVQTGRFGNEGAGLGFTLTDATRVVNMIATTYGLRVDDSGIGSNVVELVNSLRALTVTGDSLLTGDLQVTGDLTADSFIGNGSRLYDVNTTGSSTFNQTYQDFAYNQTYTDGTFNQTYQDFAYNQTYTDGTFNQTYQDFAYNQTYTDGTFNLTYDGYAANLTDHPHQDVRTTASPEFTGLSVGTSTPLDFVHFQASAVSGMDANAEDVLLLERNANSFLNIGSVDGSAGGVLFSDSTRGRGGITYFHGGDSMQIKTAGGVAISILSDNKVGFGGVTSPDTGIVLQGASATGSSDVGSIIKIQRPLNAGVLFPTAIELQTLSYVGTPTFAPSPQFDIKMKTSSSVNFVVDYVIASFKAGSRDALDLYGELNVSRDAFFQQNVTINGNLTVNGTGFFGGNVSVNSITIRSPSSINFRTPTFTAKMNAAEIMGLNSNRTVILLDADFIPRKDYFGQLNLGVQNLNQSENSSTSLFSANYLGNGISMAKYNDNYIEPELGLLANLGSGKMKILNQIKNSSNDEGIYFGFFQNVTRRPEGSVTSLNNQTIVMSINLTDININASLSVTDNITSNNVFIQQYIFSHTDQTIPVNGVDEWTNISFSQEDDHIKHGILHNNANSSNHTYTITQDGIYAINFDLDIEDMSAGATQIDVAARMIFVNGTEIDGSVFEIDVTRQVTEFELSHHILADLNSGDNIILQFIASDSDVQISTHGSYGDHPDSASIVINKISNKL